MLVCLALALFVIAMEKDEWCIKQCLKTVMFAVYWGVYNIIINALSGIPVAGYVFMIIDFIITVVVFIIVWVFGLSRLTKGMDISIPGKGVVNRAYGFVQQYVQTGPAPTPYQAPPAQAGYQQPAPPAQAPSAPPSAPGGFAPPPAPPSVFTAPSAPPSSFTPPPAPPQN